MDVASHVAAEKADRGSDSVAATGEDGPVSETMTGSEYRKLIWKLDVRLLPPLFVLWFISLVDRVNIGTARIQGLEKDLGMDPRSNQFNIAASTYHYREPGILYTMYTYYFRRDSCRLCRSYSRRGKIS